MKRSERCDRKEKRNEREVKWRFRLALSEIFMKTIEVGKREVTDS